MRCITCSADATLPHEKPRALSNHAWPVDSGTLQAGSWPGVKVNFFPKFSRVKGLGQAGRRPWRVVRGRPGPAGLEGPVRLSLSLSLCQCVSLWASTFACVRACLPAREVRWCLPARCELPLPCWDERATGHVSRPVEACADCRACAPRLHPPILSSDPPDRAGSGCSALWALD